MGIWGRQGLAGDAAFDAAPSPSPLQAFVVRTLLVHEYRRVRLRDPQLPTELLPDDWPGAQAYALCRDFYRAAGPLAETHLAEIVGADGKSRPAPVTVSQRSDFERGGGRKVVLAFKAEGLAPGRYALKVALTDPGSQKTAENASAFEVR